MFCSSCFGYADLSNSCQVDSYFLVYSVFCILVNHKLHCSEPQTALQFLCFLNVAYFTPCCYVVSVMFCSSCFGYADLSISCQVDAYFLVYSVFCILVKDKLQCSEPQTALQFL